MKMICVEGYKAFRGTMRITPRANGEPIPEKSWELTGDWLYRPDTGCWYGKGQSFPAALCTPVEIPE